MICFIILSNYFDEEVLNMKHLDKFSFSESMKVSNILSELKKYEPDINWNTVWKECEDIDGVLRSYILLTVPLFQYKEAKSIYDEFKNNGYSFKAFEFDKLIKEIVNFRDERNWKQFHNPKDLAISLSLEASELLENFQWKTSDDAVKENLENIKDEITDIAIYTMLLSHELGINLEQAIKEKIQKNKQKYPVDKAFGSRKKYTEF